MSSDIYGIYMRVYELFIIEWIDLDVMAEKTSEEVEELDSLSENGLISFDQQAICRCN